MSLCLAAANAAAAPAGGRATYDLNPGWRLQVGDAPGAEAPAFDDAAWKEITLPRAWNEDEAFRLAIDKHSTGIAWYRKRFTLPADASEGKVFLEFEGARQAAEVFLNGRRIGLHENGVMAFGFDVTEAVKRAPEENVLAVRTDNDWGYRESSSGSRYQWADRNFNANYGGLPKNVRLHTTGFLYQTLPLYSFLATTGTYVYATDFDVAGGAATIHVESEVRNDFADRRPRTFRFVAEVADLEGNVVATLDGGRVVAPERGRVVAHAEARVSGLNFWSWGYGYLYTVTSRLEVDGTVLDAVTTRTGFRKTELAGGLVKLNDRTIQIKGYAQRTSNEWPAVGLSVPPWLSDFSNRLMVESGANTVRWMHVTPWKQDVESCDRVGLMQLLPAGDAERDATGWTWAQRVAVMRDAIVYNRNHPSVVFYESGNESISEDHMREMKALRDRYDPHGGRGAGSREMLDSREAEWGGEMLYINKSARHPLFATEYSRDEGLRKYWDAFSPPFHPDGEGPPYRNAPARDYNRNQDSHAVENVVRWYDYWRERPGTGRRVSSGGLNIIFSDTNTHYRGAENYRRSGEVDAMRLPKDGYWAHRVMWDGWVDVERPALHIVGHWNYAAGVTKPVYVVSSAERVELFRNGRSLGAGTRRHQFLFTFPDVAWEAGTLRAVGYDAAGRMVAEAVHETTGEPSALRLTAHTAPGGMRADGADLALVEVEVVDAGGRRCPTALDPVSFTLTGPGEWRGGIAQGPDNYILSTRLPVEGGVNRVLVRSRPEAGTLTLHAAAEGLSPASVSFVSRAVEVKDGLGSVLPGTGLPSFLGRGPAPKGDSVKSTRKPIAIVGAAAGAGGDGVGRAFDDNELSAWASGPATETAWITFDLGRAVAPAELVLKLPGWRQRQYPIVVRLEDREVFRGLTERSLGYVTLPLKPARGRRLTVSLMAAAEAADAFGITELEAPADPAGELDRGGAGVFGIVEAEVYERLP